MRNESSWDEVDRVSALRRYDILDAPPDVAFDDFVEIAAHVCGTPIAVVNFIDEARQWFAAEIGLGVRETPLDISICSHAILQPGVFVVPDLRLDPRFDSNPLVTGEPRLRFYGGALLETQEGLPIGTMCVLDYEPRPAGLTERQTFTLLALARQVMAKLELRRAIAQKNAALAEKDLLVQEVYHRVKNSLTAVQGLLSLQARATSHSEVAEQLQQSAAGVQVFGAVHDHLHRVGAAARVDMSTYLQSLVDGQVAAFASGLDGRSVTLDASRAFWPSSEAPALGMVVIELVTNALKYGEGAVKVTFRREGEQAVLTVEDEGRGLPPDFDPLRSKGLGMRVVTGLLRGPRRGRLEINRDRGHTCFVARLKAPADPDGLSARSSG